MPGDPFAPPALSSSETPIELDETPSRAWPLRHEDQTPPPVKHEVASETPRAVNKYKSPNSSGNVVVFSFALIGLIAVIGFGVGTLRSKLEGRPSASASATTPAARAAEPPKPVVWKAVDKGDAVLVTIETLPRKATLLLDGAPLPSNPLRLPRDGEKHTIAAMADGYEPLVQDLSSDGPTTVRLQLVRSKK